MVGQTAVEVGRVDLNSAIYSVQDALLKIRASGKLDKYKIKLDTADLSLETVHEVGVNGEVTVFVVTVAGGVAQKSTNTLTISLQPPVKKGDGVDAVATVAEDLEHLAEGLLDAVGLAMQSPTIPLELKSGSVKIELIVDTNGSIKVGAPSLWKKILEAIGFDASVEITASVISTSSITLNFTHVNDAE